MTTYTYGSVTLRPVEKRDMELLRSLLNDPDISSSVIDIGFPVSSTAQNEWFHNIFPNESACRFMIDAAGETVGTIICSRIDWINKTGEVGYKIAPAFQGNNYASLALYAMLRCLFDEKDIECVSAYHFATNIASMRVLEKAGFRYEGARRKAAYRNGQRVDIVYWSCSREQFNNNRKD